MARETSNGIQAIAVIAIIALVIILSILIKNEREREKTVLQVHDRTSSNSKPAASTDSIQ